jgi:hypothetical protein
LNLQIPFDSVVRDVRYAVRSFRHAPLVALTIVTTVALGLGLVAVVFTFLNAVIRRTSSIGERGARAVHPRAV